MRDITAPGAEGFFAWLEKWQPSLARAAAKHLPPVKSNAMGFLVSDTTSVATTTAPTSGGTVLDTVKNALMIASQAYLTKTQLDAQRKLLDLQIARAQQGYPPLDIDPSTMGVPRVDVGVSAEVKQAGLWIGGIIGGLLLLSMVTRRRA
jgi:hypothetical protein